MSMMPAIIASAIANRSIFRRRPTASRELCMNCSTWNDFEIPKGEKKLNTLQTTACHNCGVIGNFSGKHD